MAGTKIIERLVMRSLAEILTHLVTITRKSPRPGYAHRDFDQLWLDLVELEGLFPFPGTLN